MSFSIGLSGHTEDQEVFEQAVAAAKIFAEELKGICPGVSGSLTGTDPNGEGVSISLPVPTEV